MEQVVRRYRPEVAAAALANGAIGGVARGARKLVPAHSETDRSSATRAISGRKNGSTG